MLVVGGVEPADRHIQDLCDTTHQLIVGRVLATFILIHPRASGHGVDAGEFAEFFLRQAGAQAGLFKTMSEHGDPFKVRQVAPK